MSDLATTNCACDGGCGCEDRCMCDNGCNSCLGMKHCGCGGGNSILWIIILLAFGGNGNGLCGGCSNRCTSECGDNLWLIIILLLVCNNGCGSCC